MASIIEKQFLAITQHIWLSNFCKILCGVAEWHGDTGNKIQTPNSDSSKWRTAAILKHLNRNISTKNHLTLMWTADLEFNDAQATKNEYF